jgi:site-specific DNA recombinase
VPELAIITEELWEQVQEVNRQMKDKIYGRRLGGLNRTQQSRTYLFSSLLYCGLCGGKFSIIIGGKAEKVCYGCKYHRFRDTCSNRVTIRWKPLEQQLVAAIAKNLLDPSLEEDRVCEFRKQLQERIELEARLASDAVSNGPSLEAERLELEKQARRLVDAVAQHGFPSLLSAELARAESRLAEIERLLAVKPAPKLPTFTDDQIRGFLREECKNFCELLMSDAETARREIQKRIKRLVLTPKETPHGMVLEVSGDVELLRAGDVLVEGSVDEIVQQHTQICVALTGIILDPSLRLAS